MKKFKKTFRFSKKDCAGITAVKKRYDAQSENEAVRIAIRVTASMEKVAV